jgi:polyhydroxyalkanoate synthesis repressor PhaR
MRIQAVYNRSTTTIVEGKRMPVIKRYPNRKLYDTEAKQYITLDGIAELVRQGLDVQIFDHTSSEDLTALTLSQVIFEQQKKHSGFLPYGVLRGLIQAGGDTLGSLRQSLSSSLGLARFVDDEIEKRVRFLISQGELAQEEGSLLLEKLVARGRRWPDGLWSDEQHLERLLADRGVPTRGDLEDVAAQLDILAAKLEGLSQHAKES